MRTKRLYIRIIIIFFSIYRLIFLVFSVPAAKPESVRNCQVVNNSSMPGSMALVSCFPGYDGGMNQTFALEVRQLKNLHSRPLATVQHSPTPLFHMKGLKHGEEYLFIITAVNNRGTSPPVTLTYKVPTLVPSSLASNSYDSSQSTVISWSVFLAIISGILSVTVILICTALITLKLKYSAIANNNATVIYAGPVRQCEEGSSTCNSISNAGLRCEKGEKVNKNFQINQIHYKISCMEFIWFSFYTVLCLENRIDRFIKFIHYELVTIFPFLIRPSDTKADYNPDQMRYVSSQKDGYLTSSSIRPDDVSRDTEFRCSGSDVRISAPVSLNPEPASNNKDNSSPYHIDCDNVDSNHY